MSMAETLTVLKCELLQSMVPRLINRLASARQDGTPAHQVEEQLWELLLQIGRQSMQAFFDSHGSSDLGSTLTLPSGEQVHRLDQLHTRPYVSIFGRFELQRVA